MNFSSYFSGCTALCAIALLLPTTEVSLAGEPSRESAVPIASVVVPLKESDDQLTWEQVVRAYLSGKRLHDRKYRRPTGTTYGVAVDCSRNQKLGVIIEFKTKKRNVDDVLPLRFSWTHSDSSGNDLGRTSYRAAWFMPKLKGILIYSDYLTLSDQNRRNGTWVLRAYDLGNQVYSEEFELTFCEEDYAPNWYKE